MKVYNNTDIDVEYMEIVPMNIDSIKAAKPDPPSPIYQNRAERRKKEQELKRVKKRLRKLQAKYRL